MKTQTSRAGISRDSRKDPFRISRTWFCLLLILLALSLFPSFLLPVDALAAITSRISLTYLNTEANSYSYAPAMSADGRYVVFESTATNMTSGFLFHWHIYRRDLSTGTTELVSVKNDGTTGVMGESEGQISGDGRFVAFVTGDTNGRNDVYLRDLQTQSTILASLSPGGGLFAGGSEGPSLSADGRYVAFAAADGAGVKNVYVRDLAAGVTQLVSARLDGSPATKNCTNPFISGDGKTVVFNSADPLLVSETVPADIQQVYLRDLTQNETILVTMKAAGAAASANSYRASLSGDGRFVAFVSDDAGLVANDTNNAPDVFVYDRNGRISRVSISTGGAQSLGNDIRDSRPVLSSDGRYVAFVSSATNLVYGDGNGKADVFLHDQLNHETSLISRSTSGDAPNDSADSAGNSIAMSADGRYVAFSSLASNLVAGDTNRSKDVFLRDRQALDQDPRWHGSLRANPYTVFDDSGQPPSRIGLPDYKINTASLNLVLEGTLFHMRTLGPDVGVTLTYNADPGRRTGLFGKGWRLNYESLLSHGDYEVILYKGSGQALTFTSPENLTGGGLTYPLEMTRPAGVFDRLFYYGTYWIFKDKATKHLYRYDPSSSGGRVYYLTSITDRNGNAVTLDVDLSNGVVRTITDPANRVLSLTYTGNLCTRIDLPSGSSRSLSFEYDESARLTRIADMAGYVGTYAYDGSNEMTRMTVDGKATDFVYAERGWGAGKYVSEVRDAVAGTTRYELAKLDPVETRRISRTGKVTTFRSKDGLTEGIRDPLGSLREVTFSDRLPTQIQDYRGKTKRIEYDSRGNPLKVIDAYNRETRLTYDTSDNLLTYTTPSPLNHTWYYSYDGQGNLVSIRSPLQAASNSETRLNYLANGRLHEMISPVGGRTSFDYDSYGNQTAVTDPQGHTVRFAYGMAGLRCESITDARGKTKHLTYDPNDRLLEVTYDTVAGSPRIRNVYDAFNQKDFYDENNLKTTVERNRFGYITRMIPPLGSGFATSYEYDADNNRTLVSDALGRVTRTEYDDGGRPIRTLEPGNTETVRTYDAEGNLTALRDPRGNSTLLTYDDNNRLLTTRHPVGGTVSHTRDVVGRIAVTTNGRGETVSFQYDADGRLIRKEFGGTVFTYAYDAAGNVTAFSDGSGATTFVYNPRREVSSITYPGGLQAAFAYDPSGNLASVTYPGGLQVAYTYDGFNRVKIPARFRQAGRNQMMPTREKRNQIVRMAWGTHSIDFQYDPAARLTQETRSNGTVTRYTYDAGSRMTGLVHEKQDGPFLNLTYGYDAAGQTQSAVCDACLSPALAAISQTAVYDTANRLVSLGGVAQDHDLDGNLTGMGGGRFTAAYDAENRPVQVTRDGVVTSYAYNARGLLCRIVRNDKTRNLHYDAQDRLLFETDGNHTVTALYLHAGKSLAAQVKPDGDPLFHHFDKTGNTLALTDKTGSLQARYAYEPFGRMTESGTAPFNPFTFSGAFGVLSEGQGLYVTKKRFYDAAIGRFLQRDPIGFDGGVHLYMYAANNPLTFMDPAGTLFGTLAEIYYSYVSASETARMAASSRETEQKLFERAMRGNPRALEKFQKWKKIADEDYARAASGAGELGETLVKEGIKGAMTAPVGGGAAGVVADVLADQIIDSDGEGGGYIVSDGSDSGDGGGGYEE